jgi:hypothetical protein
LDRPPGLHQLGSHDAVDVPRNRHERHDRLAPGPLGRLAREELEIVDRRPGALSNAGDGCGLREISLGLGNLDQPFRKHAAALAAEGGYAELDRPLHHSASRRRLRSPRRCSAPITAARARANTRSHHDGL